MTEQKSIEHHIQKYILGVLMHQKIARFRDLRAPKTDTNLFAYHLKLVQKSGLVEKVPGGYTLSIEGQKYVDRINADTKKMSFQPKIITMIVVQNGMGGVLMYQKLRQPFIDQWTLPFGKVHNTDMSLQAAAERELHEKMGSAAERLKPSHVGDAYIRVVQGGDVMISTLVHVFYATTEQDLTVGNEHLAWVSPRKLLELDLAPAIEQIVARTFFRDPYFFEEFTVNW